jgi:23S rRNA (pseudouridine1915-N3)-methyltransferase
MMNITVIALGRMKESYMRDFAAEYEKRLQTMCKLNIIELAPCALPENPSQKQIDSALEDEAKRITAKIPPQSSVISLCIEGRQKSSEELAKMLESAAVNGASSITFIIGSSFGLSEKIKISSDERISMSKMTFPHQLARVMLLEQLYRAFSINNNGKYHK